MSGKVSIKRPTIKSTVEIPNKWIMVEVTMDPRFLKLMAGILKG